jgi:cell wall assembly regulator SMI1
MPASTPETEVANAWLEFRRVLELYPAGRNALGLSCSKAEITAAEESMGLRLPVSLTQLLRLADGQTVGSTGVFQSLSGWDSSCRHAFLDRESVAAAHAQGVAAGWE